MLDSPTSISSSDAMCPDHGGVDRASRPERWRHVLRSILVAAAVVCLCLGCSHVAAYGGTASLQVSGVAGSQLAFRTVTFTRCRGSMWRRLRVETHVVDDAAERFTIVALGDACLFYAAPGWGTIETDPGHLCTLDFPDGSHTLRVTDYAFTFPDRRYGDALVAIRVGGDDIESGRHAVYNFSGSALEQAEESWRCNETGQAPQRATADR